LHYRCCHIDKGPIKRQDAIKLKVTVSVVLTSFYVAPSDDLQSRIRYLDVENFFQCLNTCRSEMIQMNLWMKWVQCSTIYLLTQKIYQSN
jgi:hypothetical protein